MRYTIRTFFVLLALSMGAVSNSWAADLTDSNIKIDNVEGGSVTIKSIDNTTRTVTIGVTPNAGYYILKSNILVQKLLAPENAPARLRMPDIANYLSLTGPQRSEASADYSFVVPADYAGALVSVTFTAKTMATAVITPKTLIYNKTAQALVTLGTIIGASFDGGTRLAKDSPLTGYYTKSGEGFTPCNADGLADGKTTYYQPSVPPVTYSLTENGTFTTEIPTATNASTYTVYYKVAADANHAEGSGSVTVKINPARLTEVTLTKTVQGYTASPITFVISSVMAGTIEASVADTDYEVDEVKGNALTQTDINTYILKVNGKGNFAGTASTNFRIENNVIVIDGNTTASGVTNPGGTYILAANVSANVFSNLSSGTFMGTLDGNYHTITGLSKALFDKIDGGTVKNVILDDVKIVSGTNVGAIANEATGTARIYNCGITATGSTTEKDDKGYDKITSNSSYIGGTNYVGGIVGLLDGKARVINCFSYANITGGSYVGGIVGYNNVATTSSNLNTMVMNCMFYGDITSEDSNKAPIYNGLPITNKDDTGVGNYNYFRAEASYVQNDEIDTYNCALMAETRYLQRFEFFRHLLNSHRELAAWWATGDFTKKNEMAKWVMEPSQIGTATPYPILKFPSYYPSVVNIDAENAPITSERNKGGQLGSLIVNIEMGDGEVYKRPFNGTEKAATITTSQLTLNITDKDYDHHNFNYYKVQLPYYNDVGTKNYMDNRVVTGWKIVEINGGSSGSFVNSGSDATADANGNITSAPFNFADRNCTNKDLYSESGRVFNQGAYWDVPEGVYSIKIQPYWAKAAYLADAYADVVYNTDMTSQKNVPNVGGGQIYKKQNYDIAGESQMVYIAIGDARTALNPQTGHTVYDNAIVLVGNYHLCSTGNNAAIGAANTYTLTSIDLDHDNEPDYSLIMTFKGRAAFHPVRYDFVNIPGLGMAQKSTGGKGTYNFGILQPKYWFEATNTALFRVTQMEYDAASGRAAAPIILHGGVIEQWVSCQTIQNKVTYFHVGGNVWFKEFHLGCHQDKSDQATKHPPVSVSGGDYGAFYLTGLYATTTNYNDNAECYINGGRFGTVAGAGMEGIGDASTHVNGNIVWQIDHADIDEFYGGGINAAKPIEGSITTVINNSHVDLFCGGPKFGDLDAGETVITTATDCTIGTYFGAGYGGNSYYRAAPFNFTYNYDTNWDSYNVDWNKWAKGEIKATGGNNGNYANGVVYNGYKQNYISQFGGVSARIGYQFLPNSANTWNVARLFVDFVSFSLATTHNVKSTLTGCTIKGHFYGGGSLGKVDGTVTSTLDNCTIKGNAFGAGYDATLPTIDVMNTGGFATQPRYDEDLGVFFDGEELSSVPYHWEQVTDEEFASKQIDKDKKVLYTTKDLTTLGQVTGNVVLNITGNTTVEGNEFLTDQNGKVLKDAFGNYRVKEQTGGIFGGGDASNALANTQVNINATGLKEGAAYNAYNVYGGGNKADVQGNTEINISAGIVAANVFGGGKGVADSFECEKAMVGINGAGVDEDNNPTNYSDGNTAVTISNGTVEGNVYGGGEIGRVEMNTTVTIGLASGKSEPIIKGNVFGGGRGLKTHGYAALVRGNPTVTIQGDSKIGKSVYGGGEIASVARYKVAEDEDEAEEHGVEAGMPYALKDANSGNCTVIIRGNAEIGPDDMQMTAAGSPDDYGHVFGAGKGFLPDNSYDYALGGAGHIMDVEDVDNHFPKRMMAYTEKTKVNPFNDSNIYWTFSDEAHKNVWEYFKNINEYIVFIQTQALSSQTHVTIGGNAFVKGSVYGGSENGIVQFDTHVTIEGDCQIGNGNGVNERYTERYGANVWTDETTYSSLPECASWVYGIDTNSDGKDDLFAPYDPNANATGNLDSYASGQPTKGGRRIASDGHTYYGNVYGGGSGCIPYYDTTEGISKYLSSAGSIKGNTYMTIKGGHILTNVYGGCESTNVNGTANITMTGGTIGVPRTDEQIIAHPVTGYLFGGGKGDQRVYFNKDTNVNHTAISVEGGRIYGSVYGGGEDGHVLGNVTMTIKETNPAKPTKIGTSGTSYYDGHVFGGGRGFGGEALTAGNVGGAIDVKIEGGSILGSVYGGGRLASVGYGLYLENEEVEGVKPYGVMRPDDVYDGSYPDPSKESASTFYSIGRGKIKVSISGGTIGNNSEYAYNPSSKITYTKGGNVFAGCMGRLYALDNKTLLPLWKKLGNCKQTELVISGGWIKSNVYGGAELGVVTENTTVSITGGTVGTKVVDSEDSSKFYYYGSVFGGGKGSTESITDINEAGTVGGNVLVELNKSLENTAKGGVVRNVFGCNDMNGTPKGNVTVHVYATQNEGTANIITKIEDAYDVVSVYGGGNQADYVPVNDGVRQRTDVIIEGCDLTSIDNVYGGGNAAASPGTQVLVKGTKIINSLYGGGNGELGPEYAANVGYRSDGTTSYGSEGKAITQLMAGTINYVYGGSNSNGDIRGGSSITNPTNDGSSGTCANLNVRQVYGGGREANMFGGAEIVLGCMPNDWIEEIYAGSNDADVKNDVSLTLTSGKFGRVFGGNKSGGKIEGSIEINIEENPECTTPIIIGEIYGGGNEAPYSIPDDFLVSDPDYQSPRVNIRAFTCIGNVYGGGFGESATVTGNTMVNINEVNVTDHEGNPNSKAYNPADDANKPAFINNIDVVLYNHEAGKIGIIGKVFGGGNAAEVRGNTNVNIGTTAKETFVSITDDPSTDAKENVKTVVGADIRGNVYGGGNQAKVTGNTNVTIGKAAN